MVLQHVALGQHCQQQQHLALPIRALALSHRRGQGATDSTINTTEHIKLLVQQQSTELIAIQTQERLQLLGHSHITFKIKLIVKSIHTGNIPILQVIIIHKEVAGKIRSQFRHVLQDNKNYQKSKAVFGLLFYYFHLLKKYI